LLLQNPAQAHSPPLAAYTSKPLSPYAFLPVSTLCQAFLYSLDSAHFNFLLDRFVSALPCMALGYACAKPKFLSQTKPSAAPFCSFSNFTKKAASTKDKNISSVDAAH
jgi:hypothetical protein